MYFFIFLHIFFLFIHLFISTFIYFHIYVFIYVFIYLYISLSVGQGSRLRPFFESVRVKTCASAWSALLFIQRVLPAAAHCSRRKISLITWREALSATSASVEPGLHPFLTARGAEAAQKRRVCRAGAARAHCAFTRRVSTSTKVCAVDRAQRRIWFSN